MAPLKFTNRVGEELERIIHELNPSGVYVLADSNTRQAALPMLEDVLGKAAAAPIVIEAGDMHKNLESLSAVWQKLTDRKATRSSLLLNIGGGMVTDLGAFAAATFKRGMLYVNVPTTLLGAVDASVGGKCGINFGGLKNQVGVFAHPSATIISTKFFRTLGTHQLLDGYAEMVKHALISSPEMTGHLLAYDLTAWQEEPLLEMLRGNVAVKERYVAADPHDLGIRHALNFGHTFGHAFEAMAMAQGKPLSHGYAVAFGMVAALVLSHLELGFPAEWLHRYVAFVKENYGAYPFGCNDIPHLTELMRHDKKNTAASTISFTLLRRPGAVAVSHSANPANITAAFEIYRDLLL